MSKRIPAPRYNPQLMSDNRELFDFYVFILEHLRDMSSAINQSNGYIPSSLKEENRKLRSALRVLVDD